MRIDMKSSVLDYLDKAFDAVQPELDRMVESTIKNMTAHGLSDENTMRDYISKKVHVEATKIILKDLEAKIDSISKGF